MKKLWLLFALGLCATSLPRPAAAARETPFSQGRLRLLVGFGSSSDYFVLTSGLGYYVLDGLELGTDLEYWFGPEPTLTKLSPRITYTAEFLGPIAPYAGVFYRHWFIGNDLPDIDTIGGRGGLSFVVGRNVITGAGAVYEQQISTCSGDCANWYPELFLGVTF